VLIVLCPQNSSLPVIAYGNGWFPSLSAIQAALAKLGLTPSNIPRLIGLPCLCSGGVIRDGLEQNSKLLVSLKAQD